VNTLLANFVESPVQIRIGYELIFSHPQPTPAILTLNVHHSRCSDLVTPDHVHAVPSIPIQGYRDGYGNWCNRIVAPAGKLKIWTDAVIHDAGRLDAIVPDARQHDVEALPDDTLVYLLGSRYCETDRFTEVAWRLFGNTPTGWARVQAICDFVHGHVQFGYEFASPTKTAWDVFRERNGVCRDYAHLAIALCRCMNVPARYCTGYVTDIGLPPPYAPMDFAGWFEAFLGGAWHVFDPRNNEPRVGRILIARGRDAADVALSTTFGPSTLESFRVWAHDVRVPHYY
jgi:transglutaminase-like putative cysteine protease